MENETIKIYLETTHKNYLNMANEHLGNLDRKQSEKWNNEPIENKVMKDFFLKKATEYTNKAEAILKVIEFMSKEDKKERKVKEITDKF